MPTPTVRCPYSGQESRGEGVPYCYFCNATLGEECLILVDEDGDPFLLCSTRCLDLLLEFLEAEAGEEEEPS